MSSSSKKTFFQESFDNNKNNFLENWMEFLSYKSISTDPSYNEDCAACASWLLQHLNSLGFKTELISTSSKPLVYAEYLCSKPNAKTVLFYGHYDVQPVDPVESWTSPPFEPEIRQERVYARGAQDNKGQCMYFIKAVETLIKSNLLDCNLKFLIEGEEECGSKALSETLPHIKNRLKADILMVCDTGSVSSDFATVTMGLRGIVGIEVRLDGAKYDLHSGIHGGVVPNPATAMSRLITTLHNEDGSIAIKGYGDSIKPIEQEDLELANTMPMDIAAYEALIGVESSGGQQGKSFSERRGFLPTIEINGLHSGYGGPGGKTIIPAYAIAKISARLVSGQDPTASLKLIEEHLRKHAPKNLKVSFTYREIGGAALSLPAKSPIAKQAKLVLDQIGPKETVFMWEGASVPVIPSLAEASGAEPLLVGFGLEEDCIHAPDESFGIDQFNKGYLYAAMMLESIGKQSNGG